MTGFHVPTAFQIAGFLFLVMPIITWAILAKQSSQTVALWCIGGAVFGFGVLLVGLRVFVPAWVSYPLANFLMVMGSLLRIQSLRVEMNISWGRFWILACSVIPILIFEVIRVGLENTFLRMEFMFWIYAFLFGLTAWSTWQFNKKFHTPSANWITWFYGLLAIAISVRALEVIVKHVSRPDAVDFSSANIVMIIVGILVAVVSHIAYAGMKLEQEQAKVAFAEKEYQTILNTTHDGFFVVDTTGRFVDVNQIFCDWSGYSAEELRGMRIHDFEAAESPDKTNERIIQVKEAGLNRFETRYRCKDGRMLDVEVSVTFMPELEGQFLVFVRDISERKSFQSELERLVQSRTAQLVTARAEAEVAHAVTTRFMSNVSHEMRTPMHSILAYSELGKNRFSKLDGDALVKYFEHINVAGTRMQNLVDSVLKLAEDAKDKFAGISEHDLVIFSPESLVRHSAQALENTAESRKQTIIIENVSTIETIQGDESRLRQVLGHLIGNALRYSPDGSTVTLKILDRARQYGAGGPGILLQVIDEGCGIPEAEMKAIFEPFYESSRTATGAGGTGLGLALSRAIVRNHKGTLTVLNRPEGGAVFEVYLPVI